MVNRRGSVRARLTLWNTLTFAFVLLALGASFRVLAQHYLMGALDREIAAAAQRVQATESVHKLIVKGTPLGGMVVFRSETRESGTITKLASDKPDRYLRVQVIKNVSAVVGDHSSQFQYRTFDLTGHPFADEVGGQISLPHPSSGISAIALKNEPEQYQPWSQQALKRALRGETVISDLDEHGARLRIMSVPLRDGQGIIGTAQVAAPLEPLYRDLAGLTRSLFLLLAPALLVAVFTGLFVTNRAIRPVAQLTTAARGIRPDQLDTRLPVSGTDEFDELAATFNAALGRVQAAMEQREEMVEQLRRFTGDASHELRTPLAAIKAHTGVALAVPLPCEEHVHALKQIDRSADRMTALVEDLLVLARTDAGAIPAAPCRVSIKEAVQDAIDLLGNPAPRVDISQVDAEEYIIAEHEPVLRVVRNLLENALHYTPKDGAIACRTAREGDRVHLVVQDSGCGVLPEHLPHLGERFYRADSGRDRKQGGAGLGLAICRTIVQRYGGAIRFESLPGAGLTVYVTFRSADQDFVRSAG